MLGAHARAFLSGRATLSRVRPYTFHLAFVAYFLPGLFLDAHVKTLLQQDAIGVVTFAFLLIATRFSPPGERRQVWVLVGIATCAELFCSLVWGVYRYRFGNVPLAVPWGHGLVYLFALRAARTPLMASHGRAICRLALLGATLWAVAGVTVEPLLLGRVDALGAVLWPIFAWCSRKQSAPLYAAAFFVASGLELVATSFGNWAWAVSAPVVHVPAGNPPSVIAGAYCLLDFAALKLASSLPAPGAISVSLGRWRPGVPDSLRRSLLRAPRVP